MRFLFIFLLFGFSSLSHADYWWQVQSVSADFPTASAACAAFPLDTHYSYIKTMEGFEEHSPGQFRCIVKVSPQSPYTYAPYYQYPPLVRQGTGCDAGEEYDPLTGGCEAPVDQCEPTKDQLISHRHKLGDLSSDGSGKLVNPQSPPNFLCQSSCKYSNPTSVGDCYRFTNGDPSGAFCNYSYKGTGVTCTAGETDNPAETPDTNTPTSLDDVRCTDRVVKPDGTTTYICTEKQEFVDPGKVSCGQVNGQWECIANKPEPVNEKKEVTTEVTEKTNPDGSKEVKTTTTTNVTNCTSVGACTTTGSVTNKTTVVNADGSAGGSSSSCTGTGCPDADGKTQSDREEEAAEEEAEEGKVEGGASCDAAPVCSGDAIQCAVLQQQHKTRCDNEKARDFAAAKGDIETLLSGQQYKPSEEVSVNVPSIVGQGTRFLPSSCPSPMNTSVMNRAVSLSFEPVCTVAESLAPLILVMSALGALLVVTRSST